jgi:hypothetical protein
MQLDVEGWCKQQNPLPGDYDENDNKASLLTQPKRPRGIPMELEIGEDGCILIPDNILSEKWETKRDFYQSYVKLSWRELLRPYVHCFSTSDIEPEHAQRNQSSPPWKAIAKNPFKYHSQSSIPGGWKWSKPQGADQVPLNRVLKHWILEYSKGNTPLDFKNVHGSSTFSSNESDGEPEYPEDSSSSEESEAAGAGGA